MLLIGAGRVGGSLAARASARGVPCTLIGRNDSPDAIAAHPHAPLLVATRNADLDGVLDKVPQARHRDLVLIQNGMLRPWLAAHQLTANTRGLLFFAVPTRGAPIQSGGISPFSGVHAQAVVQFLTALGLPAREVSGLEFIAFEAEKLIWNSAFGLLSQLHQASVGVVATDHRPQLEAVVDELRVVCRAALGVDLPLDWLMDRLCDYAMSIADYQGSVGDWPWRNGWFVHQADVLGRDMPAHRAALEAAGEGHRLD